MAIFPRLLTDVAVTRMLLMRHCLHVSDFYYETLVRSLPGPLGDEQCLNCKINMSERNCFPSH